MKRAQRPLTAEQRLILKGRAYALCARLLTADQAEWSQSLAELRELAGQLGRTDVAEALSEAGPSAGTGAELTRLFIRGVVPPYETSYESARSAPGGKTLALADIAGFYRAFGFQAQGERPDHLAPELEFVSLLCIKEAYARLVGEREGAEVCAEARSKFVREHLAPWLPSFRERVREETTDQALSLAAAAIVAIVLADASEAAPAAMP